MEVSKRDLLQLRKLYSMAVKSNKKEIVFKGKQLDVGYLKYLLEHLENNFKGVKNGF